MHAPDEPIPGFNPNAGAPIDPKTAERWAANYRNQPGTSEEEKGPRRISAYYFGSELLTKLQQQPGCVGIRFYMGLEEDADGKPGRQQLQLLAVGVDANGYDLVPRPGPDGQLLNEDGIIGDATLKCPPYCDPSSPMHAQG